MPAERKVVVVTGANSGIGLALAQRIKTEPYHVVMVCRDADRGNRALERVQELTGPGTAALELAELSSLAECRALAERLSAEYPQIFMLINNAGLQRVDRHTTVDGLELTFAVNVLAPLVLTQGLETALRAGAPSRVLNISSMVHKWGEIHWDDLQLETAYDSSAAYYQSKLASLMLTFEQARRWQGTGITVNAIHPGLVKTSFARDFRGFVRFMSRLWRIFMITPQESADNIASVALGPELATVSGAYFAGRKRKDSSRQSQDQDACRRLWDICTGLAGA